MTKKHFVELAKWIRDYNLVNGHSPFNSKQLTCLADYCQQQNPKFDRVKWFLIIKGVSR